MASSCPFFARLRASDLFKKIDASGDGEGSQHDFYDKTQCQCSNLAVSICFQ